MSTFSHGGNITRLEQLTGMPAGRILDFSANINPLGPPEWLRSVVSSTLERIVHYPDPECTALVQAASKRYRVKPEEIITGNGSTEIIHLLPKALSFTRAVIPVPSYADYHAAVCSAGLTVKTLSLREEEDFRLNVPRLASELIGGEIVFLCRPNNPTGLVCDAGSLRNLADEKPDTFFVIDEAFADFVENMESLTVDRPANVAVLISLTKIFAIPGLRLGIALASATVVKAVKQIQPFWSVNVLAQAVGEAALPDIDYIERSRRFVSEGREELATDLRAIPGLTVYPGRANFLFIRIDSPGIDAPTLAEKTLREGVAIRVCDNFDGLDKRFFRVAVRTGSENRRLCETLRKSLGIGSKISRKRRSPALMFQGTSSNAGKSVLTAAMCRILLQDGLRPAPFKAQNMSLNSFVTLDGGEMGRAQVVQSQACRLDPDVRMNPILLKPNTDTGSQVIVMGRPVANMDVGEYVKYKSSTAFDAVKQAYDSLAGEYDVIVLEGAGSPGEVNLKHHDIVNMQMARYAEAPVLLVGDIDRGGVYASFIGTMEVLAEWERALVAGFIVNRFRGNKDLLGPAHEFVFRHTCRPVVGVVQYFQNLGLPEEDSVSFKGGLFDEGKSSGDGVEVALIDLPHISNFTDFDALRLEPDVHVKRVKRAEDLNRPDAIVIPGSKNVPGDLGYLKEQGLDKRIRDLTMSGDAELVGICGGFQMIGARIADPHHLESDGKTIDGLGLLDVTTVLALEKTLTRAEALHMESGLTVRGYEIHHGVSDSGGIAPLLDHGKGISSGARSADGRVWGTYMHGIFDADEFRRWFVNRLKARRGLPLGTEPGVRYDLEPALDRLAEAVRGSLEMDFVYKLMRL